MLLKKIVGASVGFIFNWQLDLFLLPYLALTLVCHKMAWLGNIIFICIYMDTQDHAIYCVWIHFILTFLYQEREKTFGLSLNQTQVL